MSLDKLASLFPDADSVTTSGPWTDGDYVQHLLSAHTEAEEARKRFVWRWDEAHAIYDNVFDFSEKADWQSQNYLPKFKMAVRNAKYVLYQSLVRAGMFQKVRGLTDAAVELAPDVEQACQRALTQVGLPRVFSRALFLSLLENMLTFKAWVEPLVPQDEKIHPSQVYKFPVAAISAYDFWIDPKNRNRYVIHKTKMDLADFRAQVKAKIYREESLREIEADFESKEEEYREKLRQQMQDVAKPSWRKEVELLEYWGDVDDAKGNRIERNVTFTVANRKSLARKPMPNPFAHKRFPFVWGPLMEKYPSVYHEGFGDGVLGLAKMMNETTNILLDAHLGASVKAYEVNLDFLPNPTEIKSGIYPGKVIRARGMAPGQNAVRDFNLGTIHEESLPILSMLDREFQNGTGINEFIAGAMGFGGEVTATEARQKASQSMSLMQAIAAEAEEPLERLVEMTYQNIRQYNPEVLGERILGMSEEEARFAFRVDGMSKILGQMEELNKLMMWLNFIRSTPVVQQVNWPEVAKMTARMAGQDPEKLMILDAKKSGVPGQTQPPSDQAQEALLQNLPPSGP